MAVNHKEYIDQGIIVLTPTDELLTADVIHEINVVLDSTAAKHVINDFNAIRSLVSGSLYPHAEPLVPLLKIHKQMQQDGGRLVLCRLNVEIADVFRLTRLDQLFDVQNDLDTALSSVSKEYE